MSTRPADMGEPSRFPERRKGRSRLVAREGKIVVERTDPERVAPAPDAYGTVDVGTAQAQQRDLVDRLLVPGPMGMSGFVMFGPAQAPAVAQPSGMRLWPCGHHRPSWDNSSTQCPACKAEGAQPSGAVLGLKCERCTAANLGIFTIHAAGDPCPCETPADREIDHLRAALASAQQERDALLRIDAVHCAERDSAQAQIAAITARAEQADMLAAQADARALTLAQDRNRLEIELDACHAAIAERQATISAMQRAVFDLAIDWRRHLGPPAGGYTDETFGRAASTPAADTPTQQE